MLDQLGAHLAESGFTAGCPIATTALDASSFSESIRQACDAAFARWQETLTRHLTAHGIANAGTVSTVVLAAIEGALLLARTRQNISPITSVAAQLRAMLDDSTGGTIR